MAKIHIKTKQDIEDELLLESLQPTYDEIQKAVLELEILNILMEVLE